MDLKTWMNNHGVTDQHLAAAVGVSRGYINKIGNGWVNPTLSTAIKIWRFSNKVVDLEMMLPMAERPKQAKPVKQPSKAPIAPGKPQTQPAPRASRSRATF
jgi:DNA-binding XRE family transcriptional regulator